MIKKLLIFVLFAHLLGCKSNVLDKPIVTVSILPQKYFVERIAGNAFEINVMIDPGMNPTSCDFSISKMKKLSNSKVCFTMGSLPFEIVQLYPVLKDLEAVKMVRHDVGMELLEAVCGCGHVHVEEHDCVYGCTHEHEHDCEHGCTHEHEHDCTHDHATENKDLHKGTDPHIWMSIENARQIAEDMLIFLSEILPSKSEEFKNEYKKLLSDIDALEVEADKVFAKLEDKSFLIYHPALTYFADDYGLEQIAIEEDGKEPSPTHIKSILNEAREKNIKNLFIQAQFDVVNAKNIANELNITPTVVDPLSADWLGEMKNLINLFK